MRDEVRIPKRNAVYDGAAPKLFSGPHPMRVNPLDSPVMASKNDLSHTNLTSKLYHIVGCSLERVEINGVRWYLRRILAKIQLVLSRMEPLLHKLFHRSLSCRGRPLDNQGPTRAESGSSSP